ncbi:MAG: hypothetical protein Q9216_001598 [Gyalolechia sp. 2 TL-2023]
MSPASQHHPILHSNLGTLAKLPIEIRLMIWHEYLPKAISPISHHQHICNHQPPSPNHQGTLSLLRASQALHSELTAELHRIHHTLPICINNRAPPRQKIYYTTDPFPFPQHARGGHKEISTTRVGNTCKATDLAQVNLRAFSRLELHIQLPTGNKQGWTSRVTTLTHGVEIFAEEVRRQQQFQQREISASEGGNTQWHPTIDVIITDSEPNPRTDPLSRFSAWEIEDVLEPLKMINSVESVKVDLRVDLGYEWEMLEPAVEDLVEGMKRL